MKYSHYFKSAILFLVVFVAGFFQLASAQTMRPLPPDQAFVLKTEVQSDKSLQLKWTIAPDYHLYSDAIDVKVLAPSDAKLAEWQLPDGKPGSDPVRGHYLEYYNQLVLPLVLVNGSTSDLQLQISYQGCSDKGFCYPLQTKTVNLGAGGDDVSSFLAKSNDANRIQQLLQNQDIWLVLLSFLGFGFLLAFTPCVFPMLPILSSIIVGHGENISTGRAFFLSLIYVLASAVTYAAAGMAAGLAGSHLQAALQNNWVLAVSGLLFVLLSLSLFGFYELRLPHSWQDRLTYLSRHQQSGNYLGVVVMGILSTLIVSPCVSAPLVGALAYIGQKGSVLFGGLTLFVMGLGMGIPLLVVGTSAGRLLPRSGGWMNAIKAVFGVALLAMAIWLWARILPSQAILVLWAILIIGVAIYLGALEAAPHGWPRFWKAIGLVLGFYGICLLIGAASGSDDPLQPLAKLASARGSAGCEVTKATDNDFMVVTNITALNKVLAEAKAAHRPVLLDFSAKWCTACHEMDNNVFNNARFKEVVTDRNIKLIRADVTSNNTDVQALEKAYDVIAPPTMIFFDKKGEKENIVVGGQKLDDFLKQIPE